MATQADQSPIEVAARLRGGVLIPAHPLALTAARAVDWPAQDALTRYYVDAGADGIAVGVHTTQFELHQDAGLLREVWLRAAAAARDEAEHQDGDPLLIAGIVGDTENAARETELARECGYDAVLLCPWGMADRSPSSLLERAAVVGTTMPTIGFYLQRAIGGLHLDRAFWTSLFDIESVVGVKAAPFDRYATNDVAQALIAHDRWQDVALLTGNDDAIVHDLVTPTFATVNGERRTLWFEGGLLGQWALGAKSARRLVDMAVKARHDAGLAATVLAAATDLIEVNAAIFDVDHNFAGCVAGVNEALRQQGRLATSLCLSDDERLSPGQSDAIARVRARYPTVFDE